MTLDVYADLFDDLNSVAAALGDRALDAMATLWPEALEEAGVEAKKKALSQ